VAVYEVDLQKVQRARKRIVKVTHKVAPLRTWHAVGALCTYLAFSRERQTSQPVRLIDPFQLAPF
jgi:hypothetical protein